MRVDTTVVETNVHYPTGSSLLGDGVRVLIRTTKKITKITGQTGTSWLRGGERMQHWHRRARVDARRSFLHWQQ